MLLGDRIPWLPTNLNYTLSQPQYNSTSQLHTFMNPALDQNKPMLCSVVIPIFNEVHTIAELVDRVEAVPIAKEIILVNDCSTDGTAEVLNQLAREKKVRVLHHERNQGKGAALNTASRLPPATLSSSR